MARSSNSPSLKKNNILEKNIPLLQHRVAIASKEGVQVSQSSYA
ncbi:hypothetical protein [Staphylococcus epidermidis]|nr:hypothetical protein [Staphylococcus epidermidis]